MKIKCRHSTRLPGLLPFTHIGPHLPDWEHAEILKDELSKIGRKTLESSLIEAFPCTNTKAGDVRLARSVALALVEEYLGKKVT